MKFLLAAAFSVAMGIAGPAYTQTQPDAGGTDNQAGGGGTDASNYLSGPNIHQFYTDESMGTMRSEAEIKATYEALAESDRTSLRAACQTNTDVKFTDLCRAVNAM